jgi:hypothetical protein
MILLNDQPEYYEHPDNARMPARLLKHWKKDKARINVRPETLSARRGEFAKYQELTGPLRGWCDPAGRHGYRRVVRTAGLLTSGAECSSNPACRHRASG